MGITNISDRFVDAAVTTAACASQHGVCSSANRTLGAFANTRTLCSMLDCSMAVCAGTTNSLYELRKSSA